MSHGKMLTGVTLALAIALGLSGCAGKVKHSSAKACAAHGGTYNASAKSCTYAAKTISAKQACEANGGYYEPDGDECSYNP